MAPTFGFQYTSGTNPFIPSYNGMAQAQLIIDYSRNPKTFPVNKMVTVSPVKKVSGYFQRFDQAVLSRVSDNNEAVWADGNEFPAGTHNKQRFTNLPYACTRYAEPYPVGYWERDQATWDLDKQAQRVLGQRMMTRRTLAFYNLITNTSNYLTTNTATTTTYGGGQWSAATATNPYILKTINAIEDQLLKLTNGVITREAMVLALSPTLAYTMSATQEIHAYLGNSPVALAVLRGEASGTNKTYQIPDNLYGCRTVVDTTIQNTAARDAAASYGYFAPATSAIFMVRPGDIPENVGDFATAFSSVHLFCYEPEEMVVRSHDEPHNNRLVHQAYDTWDIRIAAHETLFLATSAA